MANEGIVVVDEGIVVVDEESEDVVAIGSVTAKKSRKMVELSISAERTVITNVCWASVNSCDWKSRTRY